MISQKKAKFLIILKLNLTEILSYKAGATDEYMRYHIFCVREESKNKLYVSSL